MSMFASHMEKDARSVQGPSEGYIDAVSVGAGAPTVIDLLSMFPDHWDTAYFSMIFTGGTEIIWGLSTDTAQDLPSGALGNGKVVRFLTKMRRYLIVQSSSGTVTVRVWPDSLTLNRPFDYFGTLGIMQAAPLALLHADQVQGDIGSAPTSYAPTFGGAVNAVQDIPPLLANGWTLGNKRTLNFAGNRALRVDKLASMIPAVGGYAVIIIAGIFPDTGVQRTFMDWQDTANPASRFFDYYFGPGDAVNLYAQGDAGPVSAATGATPASRMGVPAVYGMVKRPTGTWTVTMRGGDTNPASHLLASGGHAGAGAAAFDVATIGAEYNGSVYQNFFLGQIRALGVWNVNATNQQMLDIVDHFATKLDCPTF